MWLNRDPELVGKVATMLSEWEESSEQATPFARRLIQLVEREATSRPQTNARLCRLRGLFPSKAFGWLRGRAVL